MKKIRIKKIIQYKTSTTILKRAYIKKMGKEK